VTVEERLDRLTSVVETLAGAVTAHDSVIEAHDRQIDALIKISEENARNWKVLERQLQDLSRQWQAYINTLPRS